MEPVSTVRWILVTLALLGRRGQGFKFSIVHNNDIRARYDPIDSDNVLCTREDDNRGLCFGGFGRVATALAEARAQGPTIFLNAGNTFQGTPWYTLFKGDLAADLLNMLSPDAVSLGTHEFDQDIDGLIPFLKKAKFPIVCSNVDLKQNTALQNMTNLYKSYVITKFSEKIGIIGYLTPSTSRFLSVNLNLDIRTEEPAINEEAEYLTAQGVKIIIALGHSGFEMDKKIAIDCPEVDIVVGGHSHTFLYTGAPPASEIPESNYPTIVTRPNGQQVPVLQAYAFTKYLGKLEVEFDSEGHLIKYDGAPILLDDTIEHNILVRTLLDSKRAKLEQLEKKAIGRTKVTLEGSPNVCRHFECNLGNLIADAWVYSRIAENKGGVYWTDAPLGLMNAGGIRSSLIPEMDGTVTEMDVANILPYSDKMVVSQISGEDLVMALEYSASLRHTYKDGGFLQVSGMRIVIDYNKARNHRITQIDVLCSECTIPKYEPLDRRQQYSVVMPSFLVNGGDNHRHLKRKIEPLVETLTMLDRQMLVKYFQDHKVVYPMVDGRIKIIERAIRARGTTQTMSVAVPLACLTSIHMLSHIL